MRADPIHADDLLELARAFVVRQGQADRPTSAQLRRGVSLGYYALFHELADLATVELCGADPSHASRRWRASRWFAHTDIKALAEAVGGVGGGAGRAAAAVIGQPHRDLVAVAEHFCTLQAARYRADYEHDYALSRSDAEALVEYAADAVGLARRLRQDREPSFQMFLKLMVGAVKIARTRTS